MGLGTFKGSANLLTKKIKLCLLALVFIIVLAVYFSVSVKNVVLMLNGEQIQVRVHGETVQDVLETAGIKLQPGDIVRPGKSTRIFEGSVVVVSKKKRVTIFDGNTKKVTTIAMPSAPEILCAQGITLSKDDVVEAKLWPKNGQAPTITITRRKIDILTEIKEIAYSVERVPDKNLEPFESRLVQKGINGILENKIRVVIENGKETQRKLVASRTLREPRKELISYALGTVSRGTGAYRPVKELTMLVTAYTHTGHRTATGYWPAFGTVAVDPEVIPLGTPLYIEGYGFGVARDTGGSIKGSRLDVFFNDRKNALKWGKRTVQVRILRKIN